MVPTVTSSDTPCINSLASTLPQAIFPFSPHKSGGRNLSSAELVIPGHSLQTIMAVPVLHNINYDERVVYVSVNFSLFMFTDLPV